jgi:hypothetical protein
VITMISFFVVSSCGKQNSEGNSNNNSKNLVCSTINQKSNETTLVLNNLKKESNAIYNYVTAFYGTYFFHSESKNSIYIMQNTKDIILYSNLERNLNSLKNECNYSRPIEGIININKKYFNSEIDSLTKTFEDHLASINNLSEKDQKDIDFKNNFKNSYKSKIIDQLKSIKKLN